MKLYLELINEFETALDKYLYEKYSGLDLDEKTEQELFDEHHLFFKHLKEDVEELDETIDTIIEQANEPSDYEYYCSQDNIRHYENLRGV